MLDAPFQTVTFNTWLRQFKESLEGICREKKQRKFTLS